MDSETLGRRIKAAMILKGITQAELGEKFSQDDLGFNDPGRIIRGERIAGPSRIDALVRHLDMPREWFTVDDLEAWLANRRPSRPEWTESMIEHAALAEALAELAQAQQQLGHAQELLTPSLPPEESTGNG